MSDISRTSTSTSSSSSSSSSGGDDSENDDDGPAATAASPFLAAARLPDTTLLEYFLGIWNARFASTGGKKNIHGDYSLHVVCCDPCVSLQTIIVLVKRHADALAVVDGQQGLCHFILQPIGMPVSMSFFCSLQHCPYALSHRGGNAASALCHSGNAAAAAVAADVSGRMVETRSNDDNNKQQDAGDGAAKKKAKTSHPGWSFGGYGEWTNYDAINFGV